MALARKIVSGEEDEAETVEEVFAAAKDVEATAEELLVDQGWKLAETEPGSVEVNGNGHYHAIGPMVELVLSNGHVPANRNGTNGNVHHDEDPEPQQSLFSWDEIMAEEPVKPKGRRRKPHPVTASLFEWALTLEQEHEVEPVGTGR